MRLKRHNSASLNVQGSTFSRRPQNGMALVITLIMLSVITFLAVTFLAISRRERGSVTTMTEQTAAQLAADAAFNRASAELLVPILATTNFANYGLVVSTSFVNSVGYDVSAGGNVTNVNFDRTTTGNPLNNDQFRQNVANLLFSPRPPVYVRTNNTLLNAPLDFRFYLDLNRNGRYDTNGLIAEIDNDGSPVETNNVPVLKHFIGDPEWIGILERPDQPHSASNRFIARMAYIAVPSGKTLDVNYIHNQALTRTVNGLNDSFFRNQGVGTWEINLAAFFADLNTNIWLGGFAGPTTAYYQYDRPGFRNQGVAFADAFSLIGYRYDQVYANLQRADRVFANSAAPIPNDGIDQYTDGPLYTTNAIDESIPANRDPVGQPWVGADNPKHYFTTQEFYDVAKMPAALINRLRNAGNGVSSYNRYTFYRMLEQLGTESAPEGDKINVNYANIDARGKVNHNLATNFTVWQPEQFFTNAADRLVRLYSEDWRRADGTNFVRNFNVEDAFTLTNIPVWVSNRFVYSPAVHRLLQVTANIYDAQTNRVFNNSTEQPFLPTVFRPKFRKDVVAGSYTNLYVAGFVEVDTPLDHTDVRSKTPYDLNRQTDRDALFGLSDAVLSDVNIYGVPIVIGAKKGLPNFNEFAVETVSQLTRKLELRRTATNSPPNRTNTMYLVSISNIVVGVELWNPYATNYPRGVGVVTRNDMSINLVASNDFGSGIVTQNLDVIISSAIDIPATQWRGRTAKGSKGFADTDRVSFKVPFYTNVFFLPTSIYRPNSGSAEFIPASQAVFTGPEFYQPYFILTVTNRLRCFMTDQATGRIVDYVQLNELNTSLNLSDAVLEEPDEDYIGGLWKTNRVGGNTVYHPAEGIVNQIQNSMFPPSDDTIWRSSGGIANREDEALKFRHFMLPTENNAGEGLVAQAPLSASKRISQLTTWQANDPLVHYTAADLQNPSGDDGILPLGVTGEAGPSQIRDKIGHSNTRYAPWGVGSPTTATSPAFKDPMIRNSDDWEFPTAKFPSVGWLGRVHRGTPWQTIYMKSGDVLASKTDFNNWRLWSGQTRLFELTNMAPRADRLLFDVFTAAVNENATRGQLSVNQSGEAAWSAVLSGVVVLSNNVPDGNVSLDRLPRFTGATIEPAGANTNSFTWKIIHGIRRARERQTVDNTQTPSRTNDVFPGKSFRYAGDILGVPELTDQSPFVNRSSQKQRDFGFNDAAYERIPQQIMGLLRSGDEPHFTIYAFGQALKPAPRSIITSGAQFGLCTNYQVAAEIATRTVVRVKGAPKPGDTGAATPELQIESYNVLGPD